MLLPQFVRMGGSRGFGGGFPSGHGGLCWRGPPVWQVLWVALYISGRGLSSSLSLVGQ